MRPMNAACNGVPLPKVHLLQAARKATLKERCLLGLGVFVPSPRAATVCTSEAPGEEEPSVADGRGLADAGALRPDKKLARRTALGGEVKVIAEVILCLCAPVPASRAESVDADLHRAFRDTLSTCYAPRRSPTPEALKSLSKNGTLLALAGHSRDSQLLDHDRRQETD